MNRMFVHDMDGIQRIRVVREGAERWDMDILNQRTVKSNKHLIPEPPKSTVHNWWKRHDQDGAADMSRMLAHDLRHVGGTRRIGGLSVRAGTWDIDIRKQHVVKS